MSKTNVPGPRPTQSLVPAPRETLTLAVSPAVPATAVEPPADVLGEIADEQPTVDSYRRKKLASLAQRSWVPARRATEGLPMPRDTLAAGDSQSAFARLSRLAADGRPMARSQNESAEKIESECDEARRSLEQLAAAGSALLTRPTVSGEALENWLSSLFGGHQQELTRLINVVQADRRLPAPVSHFALCAAELLRSQPSDQTVAEASAAGRKELLVELVLLLREMDLDRA